MHFILGCRRLAAILPITAALSACQNLADFRDGLWQGGFWRGPFEEKTPSRMDTFLLRENSDIVGALQAVTARHEDTLFDIARRYDLGYKEIRAANPGVDPWLPGEGTRVILPTRYILPDAPREGIVLNLAAMRLFYYPNPEKGEPPVVVTHPVGIGRENWSTPLGLTKVISKVANPTWFPPPSIRREHAAAGDPLPSSVPPGPDNPLGAYAMRLARPKYLIHGTNKPDGIGMRVSHGCIQLFPEDIETLFHQVPVGTPVRIVNQPYLAGWEDGTLYISAHKPLEEQAKAWSGSLAPMAKAVKKAIKKLEAPIDWERAETLAHSGYGFPVSITQGSPSLDKTLAAIPTYAAPPSQAPLAQELPEKTDLPAQAEQHWYIQAGNFKTEKHARRLIAMLKRLGHPTPAHPVKTGDYHRVLAGPFASQTEAQENANRIRSSLGLGAIVFQPGSI